MIQRVDAGRELTHGAIADLGATLSEQVARGVTTVHMSAARVSQFDSQTLESLLEFDALARSRGLAFTLIDPSDLLSAALHVTGVDSRISVQQGEPDVASGETTQDLAEDLGDESVGADAFEEDFDTAGENFVGLDDAGDSE